VLTKAPDSIKPTIKEFGAQWLTKDNPTLVGYLQPEQRQRAANAYRSAVESAIWLSTGAAAPADQVQRIYSTLAPTASDKPELLADKRRGLLAYIAQAKVRAGPANLKAQEALDSLAKQSGLIYGDMPEETDVQRTLSTDGDTAAREIPPEMQKELRSFLGQVSPGKLDINSFSTFYSALAKKHGLDGTWDPAQGEAFVKSFNSGQPTLDIPPAVEGKTPL